MKAPPNSQTTHTRALACSGAWRHHGAGGRSDDRHHCHCRPLDRCHHALSGQRGGAALCRRGCPGSRANSLGLWHDGRPIQLEHPLVSGLWRFQQYRESNRTGCGRTQNPVGGPVPTVSVTYSAPGGSQTTDCTSLANSTFGVNPVVTVQIQQTSLPTFFSRVWGTTGNSVGATATAEAFNPSNSINAGL